MVHMKNKGGTDVEKNLSAIDSRRERRKLLADDDSLSDDEAEFNRLSAPNYPREQLELRASSHTRYVKYPERSEQRRDIAIRVKQALDAQRAAGAEERRQRLELRLAEEAAERTATRADKMRDVRISNSVEAMKNNDQPSVILLRRWGARSWVVIYNVPRYDERWRGRKGSTFRRAHVEMLSKGMVDQGYDIRNFKPGTRCILDSLYEKEPEEKGYQTIAWKSKQLDEIEPPMSRHFTVYYGLKSYDLADYEYREGNVPIWPEDEPEEQVREDDLGAGSSGMPEATDPDLSSVMGDQEVHSPQKDEDEFTTSSEPLEKALSYRITTEARKDYTLCWCNFPVGSVPKGIGLSRAISGVLPR